MNEESIRNLSLISDHSVHVRKIIALWDELNAVRQSFSDCGANDSETDWKVQATVYAISFCVPADVPKTPKRLGLVNRAGNAQRAFDCAKEMHRLLSLIQVEFRAFANALLPDELYEWLLVTCWRYCKRS